MRNFIKLLTCEKHKLSVLCFLSFCDQLKWLEGVKSIFSLQVFSQLRTVLGETSVSLHLVEVSPALSQLQAQNLTGSRSWEADPEDKLVYRRGETTAGLPVSWYRRLDDVPTGTQHLDTGLIKQVGNLWFGANVSYIGQWSSIWDERKEETPVWLVIFFFPSGFSIFLAHEFFDALPIHKFQVDFKATKSYITLRYNVPDSNCDFSLFVQCRVVYIFTTRWHQSN